MASQVASTAFEHGLKLEFRSNSPLIEIFKNGCGVNENFRGKSNHPLRKEGVSVQRGVGCILEINQDLYKGIENLFT